MNWVKFLFAIGVAGCSDVVREPSSGAAALEEGENEIATPTSAFEHVALGDRGMYVRCDGEACETGYAPAVSTVDPNQALAEGARPGKETLAMRQEVDGERAALSTQRLLEEIEADMADNPDVEVTFKVWLWEDDFDLERLARARGNPEARQAIIDERVDLQAQSQDVVEAAVDAVGGRVEARRWLTNSMIVTVPAHAAGSIIDLQVVFGAYSIRGQDKSTVEGDGESRLLALTNGVGTSVVENGSSGGATGGEVMLGIIESNNPINNTHFGWRDTVASSPLRYQGSDDCGMSTCSGSSVTTSSTHGTTVSSVALGSIREGQDPVPFPGSNTSAQVQRSGMATESEFRYYDCTSTISTADVGNAIQQATSDDVDVTNMSLGIGDCSELCDQSLDPSSNDADIAAAEAAGIVQVVAMGNDHDDCVPQACTAKWPSFREDVISVGAIADTATTGSFLTTGMAAFSGRGTIPFTLHGGAVANRPTVGLVTMGTVRSTFGSGSNAYATSASSGTSFATPQVTALAGMFIQWMDANSIAFGAWDITINVLLMGDGRCGTSLSCRRTSSVDSATGYGFPRYFTPTTTYLGGSAGWGFRSFTITDGAEVAWTVGDSGPESSSITGWKWALAVDAQLSDLPDLAYKVVNTCPSGGGSPVTIKTGTWGANRGRLILDSPTTQIHGKCLEMRVTGTNVRSAGNLVFAADYFFTNSISNHVH